MIRLVIPAAVITLFCTVDVHAQDARADAVVVRAIERMQGYDYKSNPKVVAAIERHIERSEGTPDFLKLLKKFKPAGMDQKVQSLLFGDDNSAAVEAAKMMCDLPEGPMALRGFLKSDDTSKAGRVAEVLGLLGNGRTHRILGDYASDEKIHYDVRRAAVAGLAKSRGGEAALLKVAESKKLVGDTRLLAGALLARAQDGNVKAKAAKILPQPATKDQKTAATAG